MPQIQDIADATAEQTTVLQSVTTLLHKLHEMLDEAKANPAAMEQALATIKTNVSGLATAVTANTAKAEKPPAKALPTP